jgi:hypothetical protein
MQPAVRRLQPMDSHLHDGWRHEAVRNSFDEYKYSRNMRLLRTLNRFLEVLFLRLYARNLSRSYRREPENACADSEIQLTTIILLSFGALFLILGTLLFPSYLGSFINGGTSSIGVLIVLTVVIAVGVHKRFGRFKEAPELAQQYVDARQRRWALYLYWAFGIGWLVIAVLTLVHRRSQGLVQSQDGNGGAVGALL